MKNIVVILILMISGMGGMAQERMQEIRELYQTAAGEEKFARELLKITKSYDKKDSPLIYGYYGAANMMMAKHVGNPFSKISYFKDGKKIMEEAISLDDENLELRFLRFSVQSEAPGFLGYNDDVERDKAFILQNYDSLEDSQLKQMVRSFLMNSKELSQTEKQQL